MLRAGQVVRILGLSWNDLNRQIAEFGSENLYQLLHAELDGPKRPHVVRRLMQRYFTAHKAETIEKIRKLHGV